jgi:hypothetical protein
LSDVGGLDGVLRIQTLGVEVPLSEIYLKIEGIG